MDVSSSVEDAVDLKFASARCKAKKAVLNRRPSGYWKVFSNWWRGRYATLKTRPTVHEVIEWYHQNAASSWPVGQVPCLKAVLRQSKGLRPIDGLKEYFREYRKKRKQQGGLALKATEDAASRRARPTKRRRGRATQRDSSDEEEADDLDNDASGLSDHMASEDEEDDADISPAAQGPLDGRHATDPEATTVLPAGPGCTTGRDTSSAHAVFDSWQQAGLGPCTMGLDACAPSSLQAGLLPMVDIDGCVLAEGMDAASLSFDTLTPTTSGSADPVHPAAASGMVPVSPSGSPNAQEVRTAQLTMMYGACSMPCPPFTFVAACPIRRHPSRRSALLHGSAAPSLPPLSSRAAGAAGAPSPMLKPVDMSAASPLTGKAEVAAQPAAKECEEQADDRCSTGGGFPQGSQPHSRAYMHDRMPPGFEYPGHFGVPPFHFHPCQPHHGCCFRPTHCAAPYPYRVMPAAGPYPLAADCTSGGAAGGASSSFSPAAAGPWSRPPTDGGMHALPNRQPSVESPAPTDPCYPPSWKPPCGNWGMCGMDGMWPPHPMYGGDLADYACPMRQAAAVPRPYVACCPAGPGCPCGGGSDVSMFYGRPGPAMLPRAGCPPFMHPAAEFMGHQYGPLNAAGCPDAWEAVPVGGPPVNPRKQNGSGEGEACSSSVSEHVASDVVPRNPQEPGRWSPCSGQSGNSHLARPHAFAGAPGMMYGHYYPGYMPMPYGFPARGMVTAASVTSFPRMALAAAAEGPSFKATAGSREPHAGYNALARQFNVQQGAQAPQLTRDAEMDVAPFLNDAPAARPSEASPQHHAEAIDAAQLEHGKREEQPQRQDTGAVGVEGGEGALVDEGFGTVARESIDHDLAFAWENFVACDPSFEGAMACH